MKRTILATLVSVTLSACGTVEPMYQHPDPITSEHAKVVLSNSSPLPMWMVTYRDPLTCSGSIRLANGGLKRGEPVTLYVKKGQPVTIGAVYATEWSGGSRNECSVMSTFVPSKDAYQVHFQSNGYGCAAGAAVDDAQQTPVPKSEFIVRKFHIAFMQPGPWCEDLTPGQRDTRKQLTTASR